MIEAHTLTALAPIGLSVYKRIDHFRKTVKALQANTLAGESPLFIFSDAPAPGDEGEVQAVREFARTIDGFKDVTLIEREQNSRVRNNRGGMKQLLAAYGRMIFLEEDIVTAPGFLSFMNSALDFYESNPAILSISGYCPPLTLPPDSVNDVFILRRFSAWGFATWADRMDPFGLEVDVQAVKNLLKNPARVREFIEYGEDMLRMLLAEAGGDLDALDVKLMFRQYLDDTYTLYPRNSLAENTGHDASGTHCPATDKFDVDLWSKCDAFDFEPDPRVNTELKKANYRFRRLGNARRLRLLIGSIRFLLQN